MVLYFNTSGPCIAGRHHMLPPERRLPRAMELVEQGRYFVLRSARQTGKTTSARWLVDHYNAAEQLAAYLDGLGISEGYLVLFDLRKGPSWEERIYEKTVEVGDRRRRLLGC